MQNIILQSLRELLKDKIEYHNNLVNEIGKQIKMLQNRIDKAYLDKLDGIINEDFWKANTMKWSSEKENLLIRFVALQKADTQFLENFNFRTLQKCLRAFLKGKILQKNED